jgi:hypothetical protein
VTGVLTDERVARLLKMAASLEEAIIRLEQHEDAGQADATILGLRVMQGEILSAAHHLQGDFPRLD